MIDKPIRQSILDLQFKHDWIEDIGKVYNVLDKNGSKLMNA